VFDSKNFGGFSTVYNAREIGILFEFGKTTPF
jgi:hypothetical protein